jgi:hypothetical protein
MANSDFLQRRLLAIGEGLKEGVRRELRRLRELGLPIYVARNGTVIALPPARANPRPAK